MLYAIDIAAWDLFLGLSLLFAAASFAKRSYPAARRGLLLSGSLCLLGLVGPAINDLAWRGIGIFGYAVAFPITCLALSRAFQPPPLSATPPSSPRCDASRRQEHDAVQVGG